MIDFTKDNWQFVLGTFLALLGIGVPTFQYIKSKSIRSLVYKVNSSLPLVNIAQEATKDIRVTYQNREISNLYLVSLQVTNNGNQPIRKEDFDEYVRFHFGDLSTLISAEIVSSNPKSLSPKLSVENNEIVLLPLLLNSGDTFEVKVLVTIPSNENIKYFEKGRIIGVKEITNITDKKTPIGIFLFRIIYITSFIQLVLFFLLFTASYIIAYNTPLVFLKDMIIPTALIYVFFSGFINAIFIYPTLSK